MKKKLVALYKLQLIDTKLYEIAGKRGTLPDEIKSLSEEIEKLEEDLRRKKDMLKNVIEAIDDADIEISRLNENKKKWKKQLTQVKSNREYDTLQKQISDADERIEELKEKRSQLIKQQGELEEEIKEDEKELKRMKDELEEKQKELEEIDSEIKDDEQKLLKVRDKFVKDVDAQLLARYNRVINALGVPAVVPINNGNCGGCGARIPAQRLVEISQNNRIYSCESCGRILISDQVYKEAVESLK